MCLDILRSIKLLIFYMLPRKLTEMALDFRYVYRNVSYFVRV